MKNFIKSFGAALALALILVSCDQSKEDETLQQDNHFKVFDQKYALHKGMLLNGGTDADYYQGYYFELVLLSSGITITQNEDGYFDSFGQGDAISFDLYSASRLHLDQGTYNFSKNTPSPVGTFDWGTYLVGWKSSEEDALEESRFSSGTIKVDRNDEQYTIEFDLTAENGKKVTGYFKGSLEFYDFSTSSPSGRVNQYPSKRTHGIF